MMDLTPEECVKGDVFSKKPYKRPNGLKFIDACRNGNVPLVEDLLMKDKYLVYDYDHIEQSGLHWAAKRNQTGVMKVLLKNKAYVNIADVGN
jgi:ankyrin repeat protein